MLPRIKFIKEITIHATMLPRIQFIKEITINFKRSWTLANSLLHFGWLPTTHFGWKHPIAALYCSIAIIIVLICEMRAETRGAPSVEDEYQCLSIYAIEIYDDHNYVFTSNQKLYSLTTWTLLKKSVSNQQKQKNPDVQIQNVAQITPRQNVTQITHTCKWNVL